VAFIASCLLVCAPAHAAAFSAEAVKAAFLFRFASFVQWPQDVPDSGPFVIGVFDGDAVADQLARLLPGMNVRGQPAEVRRITRPEQLGDVRILYIGRGAVPRSRAVRARAATLPILVVTDGGDGFASGGVINFVDAPRNVRFEISLVAADRARLTIDSALLAVAARVERRAVEARPCDGCAVVAEVAR
jgi:YfiR/HmsC-like